MMHSVYNLLIISSIINLNVGSNTFISKRALQGSSEIIVNHQNQDTSIHSFGESRESDENQFGLFKFASLLNNYTFSVRLEKDETEDVSYIISSQCTVEDSKDNKLTLPHCSLVSWSGNKISNETVQQDLYLDKSKNYNVDVKNSTVKISEVVSNIVQKEQDKVILEKTCYIDVSYYFINNKAQKPFNYVTDKIEELSIQVEVTGGDCNNNNITPLLNLEMKKTKEANIYGYVALMVFLGIAQSVTCGILVIKIDRNNVFAKQTSIGTLCMLISFDFCIFLQNFTYWTTLSSLMIFVFVLFFMVSIFFEPALLYFVFSTLQRSYNIPIRPLLFRLYLWLTVAAACILITQTYQSNYVYYMYPLCLLPKILDNMLYRQKNRCDLALLGGLVLPKLIYLNVISLDVFGLSSTNYNPSTVTYAVLVFIIEIMVLKVQSKWPGLGLVKKQTQKLFSYECQTDEVETVSSVICSICTEKIGLNPIIGQQPTQEQEPNTPASQMRVMKTPCLHYYHESCLKEWFKKKFECPNCRQRLPPLENDEDEE